MNIVIDTNVFISALLGRDDFIRNIIINSDYNFLFPEYGFQEVYKHKEELLRKSDYSEIEFIRATSLLLRYIKIIRHFEICYYFKEAFDIIGLIDKDDVLFIATALAFKCPVWSDDKHFLKQDRVKILTTKDMVNLR